MVNGPLCASWPNCLGMFLGMFNIMVYLYPLFLSQRSSSALSKRGVPVPSLNYTIQSPPLYQFWTFSRLFLRQLNSVTCREISFYVYLFIYLFCACVQVTVGLGIQISSLLSLARTKASSRKWHGWTWEEEKGEAAGWSRIPP